MNHFSFEHIENVLPTVHEVIREASLLFFFVHMLIMFHTLSPLLLHSPPNINFPLLLALCKEENYMYNPNKSYLKFSELRNTDQTNRDNNRRFIRAPPHKKINTIINQQILKFTKCKMTLWSEALWVNFAKRREMAWTFLQNRWTFSNVNHLQSYYLRLLIK